MQVNFWNANYRELEHELMHELAQMKPEFPGIGTESVRMILYAFEQGPLPEAVNAAYPRGETYLIKLV